MCRVCWEEHGSPTNVPDNAAEIVALIRELYAQPDACAGGPLHVLLDDFNLDCVEPYLGYAWAPRTVELAKAIAGHMRPLTEHQRGAVIAAWESWVELAPPDHPAPSADLLNDR